MAPVSAGTNDRTPGGRTGAREAAARLRTLERLNRLVSSSLSYEEVLAAIAHAASDLMGAPVVSFWVVDEDAQTVTVRAFSDPALRDDFPLTSSKFGQGMAGRVAAERRPFHVPDVFAPDSPILARDWFVRHGLSSFYGVPVVFQDHVMAVLALNGRAPFILDDEDQELLESLVAQAAVSIRNAALFMQAEARRRAAEAAEARYRELFERNLAGLLRTTPDGRILDCNEALVRSLGYPSREVLMAQNARDFYADPADRDAVATALRAEQHLSNLQARWRRADGSPVTVLCNLALVPDPTEGPLVHGIILDITDHERLATAEHEAEVLRAVARLANAAAHEINNPLTIIAGHLDALVERLADDAAAAERLEHAWTACERIKEMVKHMRHVTRLELDQPSPGIPPHLDLRRSSERTP